VGAGPWRVVLFTLSRDCWFIEHEVTCRRRSIKPEKSGDYWNRAQEECDRLNALLAEKG